MKTKISKWGNSLAVRIPRTFVREAGFEYGSVVDLSFEDGKLVIEKEASAEVELDQLLAQVNEDNRHDEIDTGDREGREAW